LIILGIFDGSITPHSNHASHVPYSLNSHLT
jgi:hypothetical protein